MYNQKGQAGSVFKILIGAVIGVAIMGIIYSIIVVMGNQKTYLSEEVFSNKIIMAMKNPIGNEYIINDFTFQKGRVLTKKSLAEQTGLGEGCISFYKDDTIINNIEIDSEELISFKNIIIVDVGIKCEVSEEPCPIKCDLSVYDRGHKSTN
jgi:hypothetical protein